MQSDRRCPNCAQAVQLTPGAFTLCYIAVLVATAMTLLLAAGTQYFVVGFALPMLISAAIFAVVNQYYPAGRCPVCKSQEFETRKRAPAP